MNSYDLLLHDHNGPTSSLTERETKDPKIFNNLNQDVALCKMTNRPLLLVLCTPETMTNDDI